MAAKSLDQLQREFQSYVLAAASGIEDEIVGTERASAAIRLGIYSDAYRLRLIEALATDYPALHTLAGDDAFDKLCRDYIAAHPSQVYNVRWFGAHLSDFLKSTKPYCDYLVFAEMAAFEWALTLAFDSRDEQPARIEDAATVPPDAWPAMTFVAHPSLQRLDLNWNVPAFWKAVENDEEPQTPERSEFPIAWMVWRRKLESFFRSLEVSEAWALDALRSGADFAEICSGLTEWVDETYAAQHAAELLKRWVTEGLISRLVV